MALKWRDSNLQWGVGVALATLLWLGGCSKSLDLKEFHPLPAPEVETPLPKGYSPSHPAEVVVVVSPGDGAEQVGEGVQQEAEEKPFIKVVQRRIGKLNRVLSQLKMGEYLLHISYYRWRLEVDCSYPGDYSVAGGGCPREILSTGKGVPTLELNLIGNGRGTLYQLPTLKEVAPVAVSLSKRWEIEYQALPADQAISIDQIDAILNRALSTGERGEKGGLILYRLPIEKVRILKRGAPQLVGRELGRKLWNYFAPYGRLLELRSNSERELIGLISLGKGDGLE
ncbi:MAG: hypothetical protein ABGW77_04240, partial [Campylobacterales bacterium]